MSIVPMSNEIPLPRGFRAAGLQKLGFESDETVEPASAIAPKTELRSAA